MLSLSMIISSEMIPVNASAAATDETAQITELSEPDETGALITEEDFVGSEQTQSDGSAAVIPIGTTEIDSGSGSESADETDSTASETEKNADAAESVKANGEEVVIEDSIASDEGSDSIVEVDRDVDSLANLGIFVLTEDGVLGLAEGRTPGGSVTIPAETKVIPRGIFNDTNITDVTCETGSQLTRVAAGAFEGCDRLTSVTFPEGVTAIEDSTFKNDSRLTEITIPGVVSIGKEAFFRNSSLTTVRGVYVTTVGESAFSGCTKLINVDFPNLETINSYAFNGCTALINMPMPSSIDFIGKGAFALSALPSVDLSANFDLTIMESAFANCTSLATVKLPDALEEIPVEAFSGCVGLTSLEIGTGSGSKTRKICESAFVNCSSLTTVRFYNVYVFETKAFAGCSKLAKVTIGYPDPESIEFSIASDAFPDSGDKLTMEGYDGKVKEYANSKKYKYVVLYKTKNIKIKSDDKKLAVKTSLGKATEGTEVTVTVTPLEGYALSSIAVEGDISTKITQTKNDEKEKQFTFEMPDCDVVVHAVAEEKGKIMGKTLSRRVEAINGYTPDMTADGGLKFDMTGRSSRLIVTESGKDLDAWHFNFKSENKQIVSISSLGVMRAIGQGNTTITVTSWTNGVTIKIPVEVGKSVSVDNIELVLPDKAPHAKYGIKELYQDEETLEVDMVTYGISALSSGNITLPVSINAYTKGETRSLTAESTWVSSDSSIASVGAKTSTDNTNKIVIKKGAVGEAIITITVKGEGNKVTEDTTAYLVVRALDLSPRITKSSIEVNSLSSKGTSITITPVYDTEIYNDRISLRVGSSSGSICSDLKVVYEDGLYFIRNSTGKPYAKEYKDSTKLYLTGYLDEEGGETFAIPISVKVINAKPDPKITFKNKINLFFSSTNKGGVVEMTQSDKNDLVDRIYLVSAENYKTGTYNATDDKFASNFEIAQIDNQRFSIFRSENDIEKDTNGKDITTGYLYIRFLGYTEGVWKQVTIPTETVTPEYVLDVTSATASTFASGQEYYLHIVEKKNKKNVISLSGLDTDEDASGNIKGLGLTAKGNTYFEEPDIADARLTDTITLKVKDKPKAAVVGIYVQDESWSKPLIFNFTLKTTSAVPKAKLNKATAELNLAFPNQAAVINAQLDQPEASITDFGTPVFSGSKKLAEAAGELIDAMKLEADGDIVMELPGDIPAGTYTFKTIPTVTFEGTDYEKEIAALTFKVKVVNKKPVVKLKKATFALNANHPGAETVETTYTLTNLPTGATGELDDSSVDIVGSNAKTPDFDDIATFKCDEEGVYVSLQDDAEYEVGKTYTYYVYGLEAKTDNDSRELDRLKITLKLLKPEPTVKLKASGSLNPIDEDSAITYTATLSNFTGEITNVKVKEKNSNNAYYANTDSQHFLAELGEKSNTVILTINRDNTTSTDNELLNAKAYKLTLVFELNDISSDELVCETDVKVTPKQVYPTLKITTYPKTVIASASDEDRMITIDVAQAEPAKGKKAMNMEIEDIAFSKDTSETIKKAFKIDSYDDGILTVWLANPSYLVQNKDYTLKFVPVYAGQTTRTTATPFEVKITVKR